MIVEIYDAYTFMAIVAGTLVFKYTKRIIPRQAFSAPDQMALKNELDEFMCGLDDRFPVRVTNSWWAGGAQEAAKWYMGHIPQDLLLEVMERNTIMETKTAEPTEAHPAEIAEVPPEERQE